jgi:UDP-N-acetylmuramate dehydrogenase
MIIEKEQIKKQFGKNIIFDEALSKYSWFNLGGLAEMFFKPDNIDQIKELLKCVKNNKQNIHILGAGSNTLFRDGGIKGVTMKLSSKFSYIKLLKDNVIEAGAATLDKKVSNFALEHSSSGFEFLSCIPGSIGGAITMNSGCYNEDISKILLSVKIIDFEGNQKEIKKEDIEFNYRGTNLPNKYIILSAKFRGLKSSKEEINRKINLFINKKKDSQPSQIKTCGSTFKNTKEKKAWILIKESQSENLFVGGAKISPKHCNFFVNEKNATASEIEQLINDVKEKVLLKTGIKLDLEIKIIGDKV